MKYIFNDDHVADIIGELHDDVYNAKNIGVTIGGEPLVFDPDEYQKSLNNTENFLQRICGYTVNSNINYVCDYDFKPHIHFESVQSHNPGVHVWFRSDGTINSKQDNVESTLTSSKDELIEYLIDNNYISSP